MSNRMTIEPTIFENARNGEKTYGVRVYDDYGQAYDNTWDEIPSDDMEIIKRVMDMGNEVQTMLDHVVENEKGIYVGGNWYDWDEIKEIVAENV